MTDNQYQSPYNPDDLPILCASVYHAAAHSWKAGECVAVIESTYAPQGSQAVMLFLGILASADFELAATAAHVVSGGRIVFCIEDDSTP